MSADFSTARANADGEYSGIRARGVLLGLIVPGGCKFRVGNETRNWQSGKAWIFDDTIEHEARNNGDQLRMILIFDTWNPYLTAPERELVCELLAAHQECYSND